MEDQNRRGIQSFLSLTHYITQPSQHCRCSTRAQADGTAPPSRACRGLHLPAAAPPARPTGGPALPGAASPEPRARREAAAAPRQRSPPRHQARGRHKTSGGPDGQVVGRCGRGRGPSHWPRAVPPGESSPLVPPAPAGSKPGAGRGWRRRRETRARRAAPCRARRSRCAAPCPTRSRAPPPRRWPPRAAARAAAPPCAARRSSSFPPAAAAAPAATAAPARKRPPSTVTRPRPRSANRGGASSHT